MNTKRVSGTAEARLEGALSKFAAALGTKNGTDPIPPSQYLFFLDESQPALQRLLAWVRSKTIRFRPRGGGSDGRSAFAVDDRGRTLGLKDLAKELHWKMPNASREWKHAEKLGLVRRESRKLFLVGDVPTISTVICTDNFPPDLRLSKTVQRMMAKWSPERKQEFFAVYRAALEFGAALQAHQVARARFASSEVQDSILAQFGLEVKRRPDRTPPEPLKVPEQLSLFIDVDRTGGVQITIPTGVQITKTDPRQITASLVGVRTTRVSELSASSTEHANGAAPQLTDDDAAAAIFKVAQLKATPANVALMASLRERGVSWEQIRTGVLVGLLRRATGTKAKEKVNSLAYFESCILEAKDFSPLYAAHLENKLRRVMAAG